MEKKELREWLRRYGEAWENRDPEGASQLFTEEGEYHVTPFRSLKGREEIRNYWKQATAEQRQIDVTTEVIAVADDLGVGRFVSERIESGDTSVTDGVCIVKLNGDRCREFREWWHNSRDG